MNIEDKLTREIVRVVAEMGLEFVTGTDDQTWYVMDQLDTRLVISYEFKAASAGLRFSGQAVTEAYEEFLHEHALHAVVIDRQHVVQLFAQYDRGVELRRLLGVLGGFLLPFAVSPKTLTAAEQWDRNVVTIQPGESEASHNGAMTALARYGVNGHAASLILRRAFYVGESVFSYPGCDELGTVQFADGDYTVSTSKPLSRPDAGVELASADAREG